MTEAGTRPLRVLHVVAAYVPSTAYGGPIVSTHQLTRALAAQGAEVAVETTDADGAARLDLREADLDGVRVRYHRALPLNRYGVSPGLFWAVARTVRRYDLVHCHGTAQVSTTVAAMAARLTRRALVISPRGSMMRWAREKKALQKKIYGLVDAAAFRRAVFHATSEQEAADIRELGHEAFVVPNAVHLEEYERPSSLDWRARLGVPPTTRLVAWVGRFDPVKNLEALVEAAAGEALHLVFAGQEDAVYAPRIRALAAARGVTCHLVGHQDGEAKRALLQQADAYAAPSHMESYGMSIVEALAAGCAVVASTGTPWQELEATGAGRWVAPTAEAFRDALRTVVAWPQPARREAARRLARAHSWDARARQMLERYRAILGMGTERA